MSLNHGGPRMESEERGIGDPLVLIGGGLTGWLSWIPHTVTLSASSRVIRLQMLNIALGLDGKPLPPDYSVNYEVNALSNTLDQLEIEQADFAAWSFGAETTLSYALHHPERVRSLTMIEAPAFWVLRSQGPLPEQLLEEQKYLQTLSTENITEDQLIRFLHFSGLIPEDVDPKTAAQWNLWFEHRQSLRIGDQPFQHEDDIELVKIFNKPVLLVKGEGSSPYYHQIIDILYKELPDARVVSFPGRHAPHIISMDAFMERFNDFLSKPNLAA